MNFSKIKAAAATFAAVISLSAFCGLAEAEENINVRLEGLSNNESQFVDFSGIQPLSTENRVLVPARAVGEAAGMTVDWDQSAKTAILTLNADAYSDKPIERYAAELINKVGGYGMELTPVNITAAFTVGYNKAVLRYNFVDSEGDTVAVGKNVNLDVSAMMVDGSSVVIPIRAIMEMFSLNVVWDQESLTAVISIPEAVNAPIGLSIIANYDTESVIASASASWDDGHIYTEAAQTKSFEVEENAPVNNDPQLGTYLGRFKITHYCTCNICNGGWGANTAWAGKIIPGQTIAVDPNVIGKLRWVYIDGYGLRRAEDCGGAIKGNHIDMAVSSHAEAYRLGVVYRDVYYVD